jgi:hypothetical protein
MQGIRQQERMLVELKEFISFNPCAQRYIRRSLDVASGNPDTFSRWVRDQGEHDSIEQQFKFYSVLEEIKKILYAGGSNKITTSDILIGKLAIIAIFDIKQMSLNGFAEFRFLYERLLGARVRPHLPSVFMLVSGQPIFTPDQRLYLHDGITDEMIATASWSKTEPVLFPEWIADRAMADAT